MTAWITLPFDTIDCKNNSSNLDHKNMESFITLFSALSEQSSSSSLPVVKILAFPIFPIFTKLATVMSFDRRTCFLSTSVTKDFFTFQPKVASVLTIISSLLYPVSLLIGG